MSTVIGTVKTIVGKFWIQSANGEKHLAVLGEVLHEGDRIVGDSTNAANATLALDLVGHGDKDIVLGSNEQLMLDQTFLKDALSMEDAAVHKASLVAAWDGESEKLSISIEDDKNPVALADATAAGDGETAAGGAASDGQITPAYFAERTGSVSDVRTSLSSVTNGSVNAAFTVSDTPDVNDRPVVTDVAGTVNEALDGSNIITGQLIASDADLTDTHKFYAVEGSLTVNGIPLAGVILTLNPDGIYQVSGDFNSLAVGENAVVTFKYYAVDNGLPTGAPHDSLPATVTLTVTGTNDQPVVSDVTIADFATEGNAAETFSGQLVLTSDSDTADTHTFQQSATASVVTNSAAVVDDFSVIVDANGAYHVNGNFDHLADGETATVTFQYVANDGRGFDGTDGINESSISEVKTVTLTVTGTNDQPIVSDVSETATETNGLETIFAGTLAVTDLDTTDTHTFQQTGTASVMASNEVVSVTDFSVAVATDGTYTVNGNFDHLADGETATVTFRYTATDDSGTATAVSVEKTVTLTVTGTNDQPIVSDVNVNGTGTGVVVGLNVIDNAMTNAWYMHDVKETFVATEINLGKIELELYEPTTYYTGTFQVQITDAGGTVVYTSATLNATDATGVSNNNTYGWKTGIVSVDTNVNLAVGNTYTMSFISTNPYTVAIATSAASNSSDGLGLVNTYYGLQDAQDVSLRLTYGSGATVLLESNGVETIHTGTLVLTSDLDTTDTHTFQQTGTAAVVTNGGSTAVVTDLAVGVAANGTYTVNGNFDALADGETATVTFKYTATDDSGTANAVSAEKTVTLTVTGTNDQPIVSDVSVAATESNALETIYTGQLLLTTDLDTTDTHTFQQTGTAAVTTSSGAAVSGLAVAVALDGAYTVNGNFDHLAAGETATVTFTYTATDDSGTSNAVSAEKTVTLTVTGTNDQPIVANVTETATETNGLETIFAGTLAVTDLDTTDGHTFQQTGTAAVTTSSGAAVSGLAVAVALDGSYTVNGNFDHLAAGETAIVTFTYTATDDSGTANAISAEKTVTLTVTGTNDQPIVSDVNVNGISSGIVTLSNEADFGITDYQTTLSTIVIADSGTIQDLNVQINLNHTWDSDLAISLRAPDGTVIILSNRNGGSGDNYSNTVFDDEAGTAVSSASAPFSGTFRPDGLLSTLDGMDMQGTWTLQIVDMAGADSGTLFSWSMVIDSQNGTAVYESNGLETIYTGQLVLTTDLDTTDTHTFQLVDNSAAVVTNGGSTAVVTDLSVAVATDGTYTVNGNFDHLAAGETATVTFQYTSTDDSGTANAVSAPKTVTLTVTGTNDQPIVSDVNHGMSVSISENFENGAAGWNNNLTTSGGELTNFLGRFGGTGGNEGVSKTFDIGTEFAGKTVTINFDMYEIDSWDGEAFKVFVNGSVVSSDAMWVDSYYGNHDGGTALSTNVFGGWSDEIHHYSLLATVDANGQVKLGFGTTLNQDISDESWGIDNLTIVANDIISETNGVQEIFAGTLAVTDLDTTDTHTFQQTGTAAVVTNGGSTAVVTDLAVAVAANGTYTVNGNFDHLADGETATVTFTYTATDDSGTANAVSAEKTVTLTVTGTNDQPIVSDVTTLDFATEGNGTQTFNGQLAVTDLDTTDGHTFLQTGTAAVVTNSIAVVTNFAVVVDINGAYHVNGNFDALADGETATVTFKYTATDDSGTANAVSAEKTVTLTVTGTNDIPIVTAAVNAVNEDATITGNVTATDIDAGETATLSYALVNPAPTGLIFHADGSYSFDASSYDSLAAGEPLVLTIPYTATDVHSATSNTANLVITITGTNDAPIATNDSYLGQNLIVDGSFENPVVNGGFVTYGTGSTIGNAWHIDSGSVDLIHGYWPSSEGGQSLDMSGNTAGKISQSLSTVIGHTYTVSFDMSANSDTNNVVSMSVSAAGASATYAYDGSTNNSSAMNWTQKSFTFVATDTTTTLQFSSLENSAMGVALDNVQVREINPLFQTNEDTVLVFDAATLLANDTDVDTAHANLSIANVVSGNNGIAVLNGDGSVTFTPSANYSGPADFTYTITDGALTSNTATVTVNVIPVADTPTLSISNNTIGANFQESGIVYTGTWTANANVSQLTGGVWHTGNPGGLLEIGQENTYLGNGITTNNVIELERNSGDASNLYTIIDAKQGDTYTVSFDYAPRAGALNNSVINVMWDGHVVKTLNTTTTGFQSYTVVLPVLVDGQHRLEFIAADSNSMGGIPNGFILSDGTHTFTGDGSTTATISDWNLDSLNVTPSSGYAGAVDLSVTATSTEIANGDQASTTPQTLHITVLSNAGNDTIVYNSAATSMDGGSGTDTLILTAGTDINFANLGNVIHNIEAIDLGHGGVADPHSLTNLSVQDVMDMTDGNNTLTIFGDALDTVNLVQGADSAHTWTQTGNNVIENGHTLDIYHNGDSTVTLKVEDTTTHAIV